MVYLGLPNFKMVDLSMANCECHNQMVSLKRLRWWSWSHMLHGKDFPHGITPKVVFFFLKIGDLPDFGASTSQHLLIPIKMWVEQCHKPPMTGNGNHTTYKNGDDWGMVCHCFTHINWYIFTVESADQMRCWRAAVFVLNLLWASQAPLKQWKLVPGSQTWQAGKCPLTCFFLQMENHL